MIIQMRGPVFVPGGDWSSLWKFSGWGGNENAPTVIHVHAYDRIQHRELRVDTGTGERWVPDSFLIGNLLMDVAHRSDAQPPYTISVTERKISVPVSEAGAVDFRLFEAGSAWLARGSVGERWVEVIGLAALADELELDQVDDPATVPNSRWYESEP